MVVCEASAADCLYRSAMKESGELVNVGGDLETIMAGLACGEANTIGLGYSSKPCFRICLLPGLDECQSNQNLCKPAR